MSAYLQIYFPIFQPQVILSLGLNFKELHRTTQPIHAYKGYSYKKQSIVTSNNRASKI